MPDPITTAPAAISNHPLARAIDRWTLPSAGDGAGSDAPLPLAHATAIEDLWLYRAHGPAGQQHYIYNASICYIAQGAKEVSVGDQMLRYGKGDFLAVGVHLPTVTRVTDASPERPYLALALDVDADLLFDVAQDVGSLGDKPATGQLGSADSGVFVGQLDDPSRAAFQRILGLLGTPDAIPALYPAITRELYYWLLRGPHGAAIARMVLPGGHARRIAAAIAAMKARFPGQVRVADLAEAARMSASRFHVHFKGVTAMTPIQYYKRLRLLEARRLLIAEGATARSAAYATGYESPSQFSREYARMFDAPPRADAAAARAE